MDMKKIEIMGQAIKAGDEMVSLTDLWKAAEGTSNQKPTFWLRQEEVVKLKESLAKTVKLTDNQLAYSKRGGNDSGTFAHWQIALAYAKSRPRWGCPGGVLEMGRRHQLRRQILRRRA